MDGLIVISVSLMLLFVFLRKRMFGVFAWIVFGFAWILNLPYYLSIGDCFNTIVVFLAFAFFNLLGLTIAKEDEKLDVFVKVTAFSALAALIYFPFALNENLKEMLIGMVVNHTVWLGNLLGFPLTHNGTKIMLNDRIVKIILACTGIESMALFGGVTLATKADFKRNIKAFLVSVPTIYVLNLLRNVFVTVSYGYSWFGENSFYIAHHVISKFLATLALILISLVVFRIIPELADLLYDLKDVMIESWSKSRMRNVKVIK